MGVDQEVSRSTIEPDAAIRLRQELVDHAALVSGYYGGRARVRRETLQLPQRAYATEPSRSSSSNRQRKRKRQEELAAAGKFVPPDAALLRALALAHSELAGVVALKSESGSVAIAAAVGAADGHEELQSGDRQTLRELRLERNAVLANFSGAVQIARVYRQSKVDTPSKNEPEDSDEQRVLLPPRSRFVLSDVRCLQRCEPPLGRFRLIVMDPPWENKSVGRGKQYTTFHHTELLKVDVSALADPDECVLGVWVTNRPQYTTFVLETLLPRWGFTLHDTWFWLKVCANGDLVTPLSSTHRLPFEKMIVAVRSADSERASKLRARLGADPKLLVSVPLRHSWKPPPECFFREVIDDWSVVGGDGARKLELFARELRPDWTSVGNEVLKFQAASLFDVDAEEVAARSTERSDL